MVFETAGQERKHSSDMEETRMCIPVIMSAVEQMTGIMCMIGMEQEFGTMEVVILRCIHVMVTGRMFLLSCFR